VRPISKGKWSSKAINSKTKSLKEGVSPMDLENHFVEEDHIQMGNLVDGNAFVHVYKMITSGVTVWEHGIKMKTLLTQLRVLG